MGAAADIMADENDIGMKGSPTQVKNIFPLKQDLTERYSRALLKNRSMP